MKQLIYFYEIFKIFRLDCVKYGSTCSPKSFFAYPIEKDFVCQTVPEKERFWKSIEISKCFEKDFDNLKIII